MLRKISLGARDTQHAATVGDLSLSLAHAMLASRPIRISMKVQMTFAAGDRGEISV